MLFEQLKKDNMIAMKERDTIKRSILGIVIAKSQLVITEKRAKNEEITDGDILNIINKTVKELDEEIEAFKSAGREEKVDELLKQREIIKVYLPKMLSEEEIRNEINNLSDKSMPSIMKHFKENFMGKVDMGLVSKIARNI